MPTPNVNTKAKPKTKKQRVLRDKSPYVVADPGGASAVVGFQTTFADNQALLTIGGHTTTLRLKEVDVAAKAGEITRMQHIAARKPALCLQCNDAYASTILGSAFDQRELSIRNLKSAIESFEARIDKIEKRLAKPTQDSLEGKKLTKKRKKSARSRAKKNTCTCSNSSTVTSRRTSVGYRTRKERWDAQRKLQRLKNRRDEAKAQLVSGMISVCVGGKNFLKKRHNLEAAGMTLDEWERKWHAKRFFLACTGRSKVVGGNRNIRLLPVGTPADDEAVLKITLPRPLEHMATPGAGSRKNVHVYELTMPIKWNWGKSGDQRERMYHAWRNKVEAREPVTYSLKPDPDRPCYWYLTISWANKPSPKTKTLAATKVPARVEVFAVDVNYGHIDGFLLDKYGNPVGPPETFRYKTKGSSKSRQNSVKRVVHGIVSKAKAAGAKMVAIEDLNFEKARLYGKEYGRRSRTVRHKVSSIPTAQIAHAFASQCSNQGLVLVAVDPAFTSQIGETCWGPRLDTTRRQKGTRDTASAVPIGRKSQGYNPACKQKTGSKQCYCGSDVIVSHSKGQQSDAESPGMAEVKKKRSANVPITSRTNLQQAEQNGTRTRLPTESTGTSTTTVPGADPKYTRDISILQ